MSKNNCESANVNNIVAVENPKPYGLFDAPSASAFFSLLLELEKEEEDFELGPVPKFARQSNNPALWRNDGLDYVPPHDNEPLIGDVDLSSQVIWPPIPKLERQTNMPDGIPFELNVEDDAKFEIPFLEYCGTCYNFSCDCMVPCECGTLYHIDEPYGMCFNCEIAERRQDLIDQDLYPDDIPDRYRYDSD
jgi:hypothetical protein